MVTLSHLSRVLYLSTDIPDESRNALLNGRAENRSYWTASNENASIVTYMSELSTL